MKITGDGIDIEQLENLERSAAWKRIRDRIDATIGTALSDLRRARDLDTMARAQEKVDTLEMVAKLPRQLIAEIRQKKKK